MSNGQLTITALQQETNGFSYSSGRIITQNLVGFCPGAADSSGNTYDTITFEVGVQAPTPGAWHAGAGLGPTQGTALRARPPGDNDGACMPQSGPDAMRLPENAGPGLWPAMWLYPANLTYGAWPASGEVSGVVGGTRSAWPAALRTVPVGQSPLSCSPGAGILPGGGGRYRAVSLQRPIQPGLAAIDALAPTPTPNRSTSTK